MGTFEFTHREDGGKGSFDVTADGQRAGEMTYSRMNAHAVIVDHTGVSAAFEGQNVGKQLVEHAVHWARENQQKIMPLCPFTRAMFERTPAYGDVWFR
jgi:predicted GNAT family acetyltransferase